MRHILIIDGQGGGLGRQLITAIRTLNAEARLIAVGTNAMATAAMLKAGADAGATGENAVIVNCRTADVIIGPVGVAIPDALMGEITAAMAQAVGGSAACKLLIPLNQCSNIIVGTQGQSIAELVRQTVELLKPMLA